MVWRGVANRHVKLISFLWCPLSQQNSMAMTLKFIKYCLYNYFYLQPTLIQLMGCKITGVALSVFGFFVLTYGSIGNKTKITVGLLAPFTGSWDRAPRFASAVGIAVDFINYNTSLLPHYHLQFVHRDTVCSEAGGVGAAVNLLQKQVNIYIGPACSKSCVHAGFVAAAKKIPMISYGCSTTTLSNPKLYPNFFRTKPFARGSKISTPQAVGVIMDNFKWKHGCLAEDIDPVFTPLARETMAVFAKKNITIGKIERFYPNTYDELQLMNKLKPVCRSRYI